MTRLRSAARLRSRLRQVLLTIPLIALACVTWPAAAQDDERPRWYGDDYDQKTLLVYGIPHSDYVAMMFACAPGSNTVTLYLQDEHSGARPGETLPVRLQAGGRHVQFSAIGLENQDSGGADFHADLPLDDTLRQMLSADGDLAVTIKGHTERYPLTGVAEPAATLLAACDSAKPSGMPAMAHSIPASFDCAQAERPVDRFICAHAVLRWQDLALSRAYAAAKAAASGPARDKLVRSQRDWVRERDRRCIADRSFKELSGPSNPLGTQAYDCLDTVYLSRRDTLLDRGAAPLSPARIVALDLTPIEAARPGNRADTGGLRIPDIQVSPDGALLAILLPSQEIDFPDQVWLYRVADGKLVEATPRPDTHQPHPDGAPMAIQALAWQKNTLYVRIALWGASGDGDPEKSPTVVLAATPDGSHPLSAVPRDIQALLDAPPPDTVSPDEIPESSQDILGTPQGNRDFLVWAEDLGHGTIELRMRKRSPGSPVYRVAWGSWDLGAYLFDARRAQLIYSADTGIMAFDMATHGERRIAGTSRGDHLYALSADQRLLVWSTRNACGDALRTPQDEDAPEHICLAHLAAPKARP